ncbi:MAG: ABC transporter permease [Candidatus Thorarchaeota archaeon]
MKLRRVFTLVKLEMKRQMLDPLVLVFTTLLVPLLIFIFGFALGKSYGWGEEYTVFEQMLPGFLAYGGLLTIYDVAAGVGGMHDSGIQQRIDTTPLTKAEYILSQMISYTIKPIIQLILGIGLAIATGFRPAIFFNNPNLYGTYTAGQKILGCLLIILIMVIFTFSSVGLGLITAAITKTGNAAAGLSFAFIVPQQIFGSFIPPYIFNLNFIGWIMPSWYATYPILLIFIGVPFSAWEIWVRILALIAFSAIVYIIGIFLLDRKKKK